MAIAFVKNTYATPVKATQTITVSYTCTVGNMLILSVGTGANTTFNTPTGWTASGNTFTATSAASAIFWKVAAATSESVTVTTGASAAMAAGVAEFSGVASVAAEANGSSFYGGSAATTWPQGNSGTAAAVGGLGLVWGAAWNGATTIATVSNANGFTNLGGTSTTISTTTGASSATNAGIMSWYNLSAANGQSWPAGTFSSAVTMTAATYVAMTPTAGGAPAYSPLRRIGKRQ